LILITCALLFGAMRATPPDPALDALVHAAVAKTPELAQARAAVDAAKRRIEPARALPDPMLSLLSRDGLMLSQTLPWPGKRALAGKAAVSEAAEIEAGVGRAERTIEARIRNAWYDLALARATDDVIEQRRETAKQIEQTTRDRYAAGLAVQQDVLRAQVELARVDEMKAAQRAVIDARTAELNRLTGNATIGKASLPDVALLPPRDEVIAAVIAGSPEAAAVRQGIESERLRVDAAKKNFLPDFVVSGGGPMWQAGVGITLPLWQAKKQRNQLAEAEARVAGRSAEAEIVARELDVRTCERIAELQAANDVAVLYRDKIVPLDELSLESALASYRAGKVPFVTVLDAVNALYADRITYLDRVAGAAKWRVAIDEARQSQ
jgi:outer membrane protein TolC